MTNNHDSAILFTTHDNPFTNWSAHQVRIWGKTFQTVEHAFHYQKYIKTNAVWAEKIRKARSPWLAKQLAWEHPIDTTEWNQRRKNIMRQLIEAKVEQHEDVRHALLGTDQRAIIEKGSDSEKFWGVGQDYTGQNTLGEIWMRLRSELTAQR